MTTQADFLSQLRLRVNDDAATRWSDEELLLYLQESVLRYSKLFPRLVEREVTVDGTVTRFAIPDNLVDLKVQNIWEIREDRMVEVIPWVLRSRWQSRWWDITSDEIILGYTPPGETVLRIRYSALHELPDSGDSTVPSEDEDLIYTWSEYLAWRKIGGSDASLSRWRDDGGKRNDGPIIPHYIFLQREYDRLVTEKKAGGRYIQLFRSERRRTRWGGVLW